MLASEFGTGQVFWSILWFFLFFVWIMMIFSIFGDIIRSDDMGGVAKAIWVIFIIGSFRFATMLRRLNDRDRP